MPRYQERIVEYRPINISPDDLISLSEAAQLLDISLSALSVNVANGRLTEIKDTQATHGGRHQRWLLRAEVLEEARIRAAA
jgi:hypothetical protein